jgi:hypothetical protein
MRRLGQSCPGKWVAGLRRAASTEFFASFASLRLDGFAAEVELGPPAYTPCSWSLHAIRSFEFLERHLLESTLLRRRSIGAVGVPKTIP